MAFYRTAFKIPLFFLLCSFCCNLQIELDFYYSNLIFVPIGIVVVVPRGGASWAYPHNRVLLVRLAVQMVWQQTSFSMRCVLLATAKICVLRRISQCLVVLCCIPNPQLRILRARIKVYMQGCMHSSVSQSCYAKNNDRIAFEPVVRYCPIPEKLRYVTLIRP